MSKVLVGRKVAMTQVFDEEGMVTAVTVVDVSSNVVVQKKSEAGKDGYAAVKLGFGIAHKFEKEGEEPKWRLSKPRIGVFQKAGIDVPRRHLCEFRVAEAELEKYEVGQDLGADTFTAGDYIDVAGTSKGRGFTGVMKRHNFHGTKATHGVHEFYRHGGSIGCSAWPSRVFPGKKMAGQHGNARVTIQNLKIHSVMPEENLVLVAGGIPGPNGGLVEVTTSIKKGGRRR